MARAKTVESSSPATESLIELLNGTKYFPLIVACERSGIRLLNTELSAPPEYQQGFLADRFYLPDSVLNRVASILSKSNRLILVLNNRNFDTPALHKLLETLPCDEINGTYFNETACLVTEGWLSLVGKTETRNFSKGNFSAARICDDQTLTQLQSQKSLDSVAKLCDCFDEMTKRDNRQTQPILPTEDLHALRPPSIARLMSHRELQVNQFEKCLKEFSERDSDEVGQLMIEIAEVFAGSGLVLFSEESLEYYSLARMGNQAVIRRLLDASKVVPTGALLRSLRVIPRELLNDQRLVNALSMQDIRIEQDETVMQLSPSEFFSYFDRVKMHVPNGTLKNQLQKWLSKFVKTSHDFGGDFGLKKEFAQELNRRVLEMGWSFKCWSSDCKSPAALYFSKIGASECGLFSTSHALGGHTRAHKTSSVLRSLRIVAISK